MKTPMSFTMTAQHIALIREMYVGWQDYPEEHLGAPEIDPKRPYGNSSVFRDVAKIIGELPPDDDGDWAPGQEERLARIHAEAATALQIVLTTGSFEPGEFRRTDPWGLRSWVRVPAPHDPSRCDNCVRGFVKECAENRRRDEARR